MTDTPKAGDNNPPEPTPFEKSQEAILDLYQQAEDWLDGDPISTQGEADSLQKLMRMIQNAQKAADKDRKKEAKPFDDGKSEIQKRYNPLIQKDKGKCDLAIGSCKKALLPWLVHLEKERQAEAEKARKEAEEQQRIAMEELRKAQETANLKAREEAEAKLADAKKADTAATKLETTRVKASGGFGRASSLRASYTPQLVDLKLAIGHYWKIDRVAFENLVNELAAKDVGTGSREIPGFNVKEEKSVV
jgi:hypothetical protein